LCEIIGQLVFDVADFSTEVRFEFEHRPTEECVNPTVHLWDSTFKIELGTTGAQPVYQDFINQSSHFLMLRSGSQFSDYLT